MPACISCGAYLPGDGPGDPETVEAANAHLIAGCPGREPEFMPVPQPGHGPDCACGWVTREERSSFFACGRK